MECDLLMAYVILFGAGKTVKVTQNDMSRMGALKGYAIICPAPGSNYLRFETLPPNTSLLECALFMVEAYNFVIKVKQSIETCHHLLTQRNEDYNTSTEIEELNITVNMDRI